MAEFTVTRQVESSALALVQNFNLRQLKKREKNVSCGEKNNHSTVLNKSRFPPPKKKKTGSPEVNRPVLMCTGVKTELRPNRQPVGTNTSNLHHPHVCFDCCCNAALFTVRCFSSNHRMQETQTKNQKGNKDFLSSKNNTIKTKHKSKAAVPSQNLLTSH